MMKNAKIIIKDLIEKEENSNKEEINNDGEEVKQGEIKKIDEKKLKDYLLEMNKGITLERD
jgi:hypothetical protein